MPISTISQFTRGIQHRDANLTAWSTIFSLAEGSSRYWKEIDQLASNSFPATPKVIRRAAAHAMFVRLTNKHPRTGVLPSVRSRYTGALS